uniref:Follistatin-like domain-containing protein n=1 Tax=Caenorhabditis japonica TaxID=281687 RepID=A0A8R1I1R6_CAEJA
MECKSPMMCVQRVRPCIGRSCKEVPTCEQPDTCEAVVCPPSQRCSLENGKPMCKKHIPPTRGIIGKATLDEKQFQNE